jgi:hypothetical protein
MKSITIALLLSLSLSLFAQDKIIGSYRDNFGNRILLNSDNTFKYNWNFDLSASWTKGTWTLVKDTIYFHMVPTYDTLSETSAFGNTYDTLILSTDETPERLTQTELAAMGLSSGGQNLRNSPQKLVFRKGRLYKIQEGKLVTKKQKGFWTSKKWVPWYFKSDD